MKRLKFVSCLLIGLGIPLGVFLFVPPVAQPLWYHNFADQRCLLCVPHSLNVLSNLPFVLVGVWGMLHLLRSGPHDFHESSERASYLVFFSMIALTGVGSAYYHWDPDNDRLLWDRLPLAIAFVAFFSSIIAERIDRRAGLLLLVPLMILGAGSVLYWHWTEVGGRGDLRPYFLVQFYPLVAVPFILVLFPARYTRASDIYGVIVWYAVAKGLEVLDKQIYSQGQVVSGHTLKHLVAAVSAFVVLFMLWYRRPLHAATSATPLGAVHP